MKKLFIVWSVVALLASCGGGGSQKENTTETQPMTEQEESNLVNKISDQIQSDKQDIQKATEEGLQEVDSLLENF